MSVPAGILDPYAFPAARETGMARPVPAPTFGHAAEASILAHSLPGAWSAGTAVKYRQTLSCGLGGTDLEALESLLAVETALMIDDDDPRDQHITEGRHRITAMRDAKVQHTVLVRLELTDADV
jgi:hypothetical protein